VSIDLDIADNVQHALELLAPADPGIRPVAGATDVVLRLHVGKLRAHRLVSIADLPELSFIRAEPEGFRFGAGTLLADLLDDAAFCREYPCAAEGLKQFASPQIRNRATVGGNIGNASPAADMVPPLVACGAWVTIASKRVPRRALPLEDVFLGFGKTALAPDELITEIFLPRRKKCFQRYAKFGNRNANVIAVINLALCMKLSGDVIDEIRVCYGSVAPKPYRAVQVENYLTGQRLTPEVVEEIEDVVREELKPIDDVRGSKRYKLRLAINAMQDSLMAASRQGPP
jgi:carbon-monoxide dehydrogenase medium subunit